MALTNQPYLPLYVQDWLSNNKLKLCSPGAHGLMINIMCLMHKSDCYGTVLLQQKFKQTDQQILNFATMIARLLPFELAETELFLTELLEENVLRISEDSLICDRMVKDAQLSIKRSLVGAKGGKNTSKNNKKFATAKVQANAEIETEIVNESDNENKKKEKEELVFPYHSELFMQKWNTFINLSKQKKKPFASKQTMLNNLAEFDEAFSIKQIDLAIANNWQGLTFADTKAKYLESLNNKTTYRNGTNQKLNIVSNCEPGRDFGKL